MVEPRKEQRLIRFPAQSFVNAMELLVQKIKESNHYSKFKVVGVYGIPRGGLPLAVYLSHHLDMKLLEKPLVGCLVVDDIADSGKTLDNLKIRSGNSVYFATIHYKEKSLVTPHFYIMKSPEEHWMCYHWENYSEVHKKFEEVSK